MVSATVQYPFHNTNLNIYESHALYPPSHSDEFHHKKLSIYIQYSENTDLPVNK